MNELTPVVVRPENLTDITFEAIRDSIINQTLPPGSRVSEQKVASMLQVSKTPVREALLRLRHVGLVEPVERGLRVVMPSTEGIRNAYELRAGLERTAAGLAANRSTPAQCENILELGRKTLDAAEAGERQEFRRLDGQFHRAVASAASNELLASAVEDGLILTSVLRERDIPRAGDSVSCAREHVAVAESITAGDANAAAQRMGEHVLHVMSIVIAARPRPSD